MKLASLFPLCTLFVMASGSLKRMPDVQEMVAANSRFMLNFLHENEQKGDNMIFSPHSISTALAMTFLGARGATAEQMKSVLQWQSAEQATQGFGKYLSMLQQAASNATAANILVTSQRIYIKSQLTMKQDFRAAVQQRFLSDAIQANFSGNAEGERQNINAWVADQTRGKIKDLLPPGSIDPLTAMVLLQATYFKGSWLHKFAESDTRKAEFFSPQGRVQVDMMQQEEKFNYTYSRELKCAAVELPYARDTAMSMLVVLPDARDGLPQLESALSFQSFQNILHSLNPVKVNLKLPRFKAESSFKLKGLLSKLGMALAFSDQADFSGMATGPGTEAGLSISEVFHKAVVEVTEEGTEAAAAMAVVAMQQCMPLSQPFIADLPFLFFVVDKKEDVVLFSAHIAVVEVNEEGTEAKAATVMELMELSAPLTERFVADHPFLFFILDGRADVVLFAGHIHTPPSALPAKQEL